MNESDFSRFIVKVEKTDSCWIWRGARNAAGYGNFYVAARYVSAHRTAYRHYFGEIPDGLLVMHKCDNVSCVNPDHLAIGTPKDNVQDMIKKGRAVGVPNGSEHTPLCKLNWGEVRGMREKLAKGIQQAVLAKEYGVSDATVSLIKLGKTWRET